MIKNDVELIEYQKLLSDFDNLINRIENESLKVVLPEVYLQQMETLDVLRNKRLGIFFLITAYNSTKKNLNKKRTIVIEEQTSLVDLANAFYGSPEYYQHIYEENDLTDINLTVGQVIILPDIPNDAEKELYESFIFVGEVIAYAYEGVNI